MSRGFICDGCNESIRGEPMLELEMSASVKSLSGGERREPREKTLHYCEGCTDARKFQQAEFQPRMENLIHGAIAVSSWRWGHHE